MIYHFTLQQVAVVLGAMYFIGHGWALWRHDACKKIALAFPRNYPAGVALTLGAGAWFCWLILNADLMDFAPYRDWFFVGAAALTVGMIIFVREFLAVRATGALYLLLANVLLDAAFLDDRPVKFVITVAAYAYVVFGILFVAAPYLMRDMLTWFYRADRRGKLAAAGGVAFGLLLLGLGIFVY